MKKLVLIVAGVIFAVLLTSISEYSPWEFTYIGIAEGIQKGKTFKIPLKTRRDTYDPHDRSLESGYEQLETDLDSTSSANASTESVSPAKEENTDVKENKDATTSEQTTEEKTEETKPEA